MKEEFECQGYFDHREEVTHTMIHPISSAHREKATAPFSDTPWTKDMAMP